MSLENHKITTYEDSVSSLPDYPSDAGYTAAMLKAVFDGRTDKEIKQKFNALIDELISILADLERADSAAEQRAKEHADNAVSGHNTDAEAHSDIRSQYVKKTDFTLDKGITVSGGTPQIEKALNSDIDGFGNQYKPIVPANLVYAVERANATLGMATAKDARGLVSGHNTSETAHSDIRSLISELTRRVNAAIDSDDITLDQLSELVAYIKNNRSLIDSVTTAKANAADVYNRETIDKKLTERDERISELEEDVGDMDTALDSVIASQKSILAMQNALIGGDA